MAGKEIEKDYDESNADSFIAVHILQVYYDTSKIAIKHLRENGDTFPAVARATLIERWKQIQRLIQEAFLNGVNEYTRAHTYEYFDVASPAYAPDLANSKQTHGIQ